MNARDEAIEHVEEKRREMETVEGEQAVGTPRETREATPAANIVADLACLAEGIEFAKEDGTEREPDPDVGGMVDRTTAAKRGVPEYLLEDLYDPAFELDATSKAMRAVSAFQAARIKGGKARPRMLVLLGKVGRGKSIAAGLLACQAMAPGEGAVWIGAPDYCDEMRDREASPALRKRARVTSMLLLDELGDEFLDQSGRNVYELVQLMKARFESTLPIVMTGNITRAEFERRYGDRIVSRILQVGAIVECGGPDRRAKMRKEANR